MNVTTYKLLLERYDSNDNGEIDAKDKGLDPKFVKDVGIIWRKANGIDVFDTKVVPPRLEETILALPDTATTKESNNILHSFRSFQASAGLGVAGVAVTATGGIILASATGVAATVGAVVLSLGIAAILAAIACLIAAIVLASTATNEPDAEGTMAGLEAQADLAAQKAIKEASWITSPSTPSPAPVR
jgi:hypothetical protein